SLAMALARDRPGGRVVGVDIAAPYVAFARQRARTVGVGFEIGNACHLRFAGGAFSGALAQLSLNFVADAPAAVREMRRVTRPGGGVAGAVWDFRGGLVYQRLFWDTAAAVDRGAAAARDRLFSHPLALPGGLAVLWQGAGLTGIEEASLTIRM